MIIVFWNFFNHTIHLFNLSNDKLNVGSNFGLVTIVFTTSSQEQAPLFVHYFEEKVGRGHFLKQSIIVSSITCELQSSMVTATFMLVITLFSSNDL